MRACVSVWRIYELNSFVLTFNHFGCYFHVRNFSDLHDFFGIAGSLVYFNGFRDGIAIGLVMVARVAMYEF